MDGRDINTSYQQCPTQLDASKPDATVKDVKHELMRLVDRYMADADRLEDQAAQLRRAAEAYAAAAGQLGGVH